MTATAAWRRLRVVIPVVLALVAALSVTLLSAPPADAQTPLSAHLKRDRKVLTGVKIALRQKGDPYVYGASGPNAFDCSGLTQYAYGKAGLYLPRTSDAQAGFARKIDRNDMRRGDLVFFHHGGNVYHAAIYLGRKHGERWILHAPYTGTQVRREAIWTSSWFPGTLRPQPRAFARRA